MIFGCLCKGVLENITNNESSVVEDFKNLSSKVAPGMSTTFWIIFKPEERKEYSEKLIIETERERFFVPIIAKDRFGL